MSAFTVREQPPTILGPRGADRGVCEGILLNTTNDRWVIRGSFGPAP